MTLVSKAGVVLLAVAMTAVAGGCRASPSVEPDSRSEPVTKHQALDAWAQSVGVFYGGDCAQAVGPVGTYCSVEQEPGVFALGPLASEFDSVVVLRQDDADNWVLDHDRPFGDQ